MSLLLAELRKVWGNRLFPILLAVLAAANLLLLWMGTQSTVTEPPAEAYRAVSAAISSLSMEEKGNFVHSRLTDCEGLLQIENYYQQLAWDNGPFLQSYREKNAALFDTYEQVYLDKAYSLVTDSLLMDWQLFTLLANEYDTVAGYTDFLLNVQKMADQLSSVSIFQEDTTGYDLANIKITAKIYAGLGDTPIDYYPQKGLYTAISYAFTDLILLAAMLVLSLLLVRQERDNGLLSLVRSLPGGRIKTAVAKIVAFALSLIVVVMLLYGTNLVYCETSFGFGALSRSIQSVPALMHCTMQITVSEYLFRFLLAKWLGAIVIGLWVMLAALLARRPILGWVTALGGVVLMFGIRALIPATSRLNVLKYANLASLLQTNELLGNYRNLYWFGSPIGLPLVEWTAAILYGGVLTIAFCWVFSRAQLLPAPRQVFLLLWQHKTHATSIMREEARKLFVLNGAAVFLSLFTVFGIWQSVNNTSNIGPEEIYYAYYMKHISGPWTQESYDWLKTQGKEFEPMLKARHEVSAGRLNSDVLIAFNDLQQKYTIYRRVIDQNINGVLKERPGAWLVYDSGYRELFGFESKSDVQDTLYAGLLCAICFSGLFSMERRGGMDTILCTTPLGRKHTVRAKLGMSVALATGIAWSTCMPHLVRILRDYGLPVLFAPAISIPEFENVPRIFTLSDIMLFWFICRLAACLCMACVTLWLGRAYGKLLPALFVSAVAFCLPPMLSLAGMKGGIEWLGFWPLFHAVALLKVERNHVVDGASLSNGWIAILLLGIVLLLTIELARLLQLEHETTGLRMDA